MGFFKRRKEKKESANDNTKTPDYAPENSLRTETHKAHENAEALPLPDQPAQDEPPNPEDVAISEPQAPQPPVDAVINVSVSPNELEAYIEIKPPLYGGAAPTFESLEDALKSFGITYNVSTGKLREIAESPPYGEKTLIARGSPPKDGVNGTAAFLFDTGNSLRLKEDAEGNVDFKELGIVKNVKLGQALCHITPPTKGSPGITVKGRLISQKPGRPVPSYAGKNTAINQRGTQIISQIDGQADFNGNKINVNEVFYVKGDVDNSTGNIKVIGNLVVQGIVSPGFEIQAGGNADFKGTVEASNIKAKGNIKLQSGITGSDIFCEGDLKGRFIENCNVFVKGNIDVEYILNSNIKCGKNIKTTGAIGKIIGGSCVAGQNIEAKTIGSSSNIKTSLELGTDPDIIVRQQELLSRIPELKKQIESLKPIVKLLRQIEAANRLTPEKKEMLDNACFSYSSAKKAEEDTRNELEHIAADILTKGYGRIACTGAVYRGTEIIIGTSKLTVTDSLSNISFYYDEGMICQGSAR